jgi:hypothetical protein
MRRFGSGRGCTTVAAWLGLVVVLSAAAAVRFRLLDVPLERDEGEFAYIGALLLDGVPPFAAANTMKLPGTPVMYALAMAAFGRSIAGIRIGLLVTTTASTVLLFLLARRWLGTLGAFTTAATFAGLSLAPAMLGTYAHATHFVVLAAVAGLLVLSSALEPYRPGRLLAAGALFGVAILMKQPGAVFAAFGLGWVAIDWYHAPRRIRRDLSARMVTFALGVAAPAVVTAAALWQAGTLDTAWAWTVGHAHAYAVDASLAVGAQRLAERLRVVVPDIWGLAGLVVVGLAQLVVPRVTRRAGRAYVLGLFAFSAAGVCAGLQFRPHYFVLLAPSAALLVGVAATECRAYAVTRPAQRAVGAVFVTAVVLGLAQSVWAQREILFRASPIEVSRAIYRASPFPEALEVGRYLRERSDPTDTIGVLGSEPEIPFYAGRRSASRHIYMYPLMDRRPSARAMQQELIDEIERARPSYVVYVRSDSSWARAAYSERLVFDWIPRFLAAHYAKVGQVDILGPRDTRYTWDGDAAPAPVTPYTHVIVFRRVGDT